MAENPENNSGEAKENKGSGSKISNTEWGMAIAILLLIDLAQIGLDFVGIGIIANTFIDILVGMAWPTYLYLRGVNLKSVKMFGNIINFLYNAYLGRKLELEDFGLIGLVGSFVYITSVPLSALAATVTHRSAYLL